MSNVITIYEAKTHLSKYIKQAKAGTPVYIGSYGNQEVVLMAADATQPKPLRPLGIMRNELSGKYNDMDIIGSDPEIIAAFEESQDRPLP